MRDDFLDTNIMVYQLDDTDDLRRRRSIEIVESALRYDTAQIGFQVVTETLNVITSKIREPLSADRAALFFVEILQPLWHVHSSANTYLRALQIAARYQIHYFDALMVSAAIEAGSSRLLTEDLTHGQRIEGVLIHNPFR